MMDSASDKKRRPAVFLDRDGVLNVDHGYVHRLEQIEWCPDAPEAVAALNRAGYWVFVVTNQSGVARGYYDETAVLTLHRQMAAELADRGARIDDWRYCPYHPDGVVKRYRRVSDCRKPAPGMLLELFAAYPVDRGRSFMIGDKDSDMAAARAAGVRGVRYRGGSLLSLVEETLGQHQEPVDR